MSMELLGYTSPFVTSLRNAVQDRLEQCYRQARRIVRPFRYWNLLKVLKIAHHALAVYGMVVFLASNKLLGRMEHRAPAASPTLVSIFRRSPSNWNDAMNQGFWFAYVFLGGGFPFYGVRHPTQAGWFRNWAHPLFYWGYLSVYKCIWSTWHTVSIAHFLTDPRRNPQWRHPRFWKRFQRDHIVQLQNLRYQHQWSAILQELHNTDNQRMVQAVRIDNRWVGLGAFGAAVQDVIDDTLDRLLLRPARLVTFFQRLGTSFPRLNEVSIAMTLNLPLTAISALLQSAPNLKYLRLDGVGLSVHDLQADLLEFGSSLRGVVSRRDWKLKTLLIEDCRLENDEPDPQMRTRYSMDLLLRPTIYYALTPPTYLLLTELRLWVLCQPISALELSVMLAANTSLVSLDLHLIRDNSDDAADAEQDPVDWIVLPIAQVLQYRNSTLTHLSLQLPTTIPMAGWSYRALVQMMEHNETLETLHLIRTDTQARIRIYEVNFYLQCNRLGRRDFRLAENWNTDNLKKWVEMFIQQKRNTAILYYFLSLNPSLLLAKSRTTVHDARQTKSLRQAWKVLQRKSHWATLAFDVKM